MSLGTQPRSGTFSRPATYGLVSTSITTAWRVTDDLSLLNGGAPLPPTPWSNSLLDDNKEFLGGPKLRGILWSHVKELGSQPIGSLPDAPGLRGYRDIANHYGVADFKLQVRRPQKKVLVFGPAWKWSYCAFCSLGREMSWLWADGPATVASQPSLARELVGATSRDAQALLSSDHLRVPASEPDSQLVAGGFVRRELLVDTSDATLPVVGGLGVDVQTRVVGVARSAPELLSTSLAGSDDDLDFDFPPFGSESEGLAVLGTSDVDPADVEDAEDTADATLETPITGGVFAYSAVRNELFVARATGGSTSLRQWDTFSGRWRTLDLGGSPLGRPLALTVRVQDNALYLLDRPFHKHHGARLVRVDLGELHVDVLEPHFLAGKIRRPTLAQTETELLVGYRKKPGGTRIAHVRLLGDQPVVVDRYQAPSKFVGALAENDFGVYFLVPAPGGGFDPVRVPRSSFVPAGCSASPVF